MEAGRILGTLLAMREIFPYQTVSLIGFSLGTQVIKSCLETLHSLGAHDIIHNVTLMGGATHFDEKKALWEKTFAETVAGKIKNAYSLADNVLYLYMTIEVQSPIGRNEPFKESANNLKSDRYVESEKQPFKFKSYKNNHGHTEYRAHDLEIYA